LSRQTYRIREIANAPSLLHLKNVPVADYAKGSKPCGMLLFDVLLVSAEPIENGGPVAKSKILRELHMKNPSVAFGAQIVLNRMLVGGLVFVHHLDRL